MKLILLVVLLVKAFAREPGETSSLNMEASEPINSSSYMEASEPGDSSLHMEAKQFPNGENLYSYSDEVRSLSSEQLSQYSGEETLQMKDILLDVAEESQNPDDHEIADMILRPSGSRWCQSRGGKCPRRKKSCPEGYQNSPKGKPYCKIRTRRCCYPIPKVTTTTSDPTTAVASTTTAPPTTTIPGGYYFTSSGQRFLLLTDKRRTWNESEAACGALGLQMAHPRDPIALRSTLVNNNGLSRCTWLNARGTGSSVAWQDSWASISQSSSLWYHGTSKWNDYIRTDYCLVVLTTEAWLNDGPNAPYHCRPCDQSRWTLCDRD